MSITQTLTNVFKQDCLDGAVTQQVELHFQVNQ